MKPDPQDEKPWPAERQDARHRRMPLDDTWEPDLIRDGMTDVSQLESQSRLRHSAITSMVR